MIRTEHAFDYAVELEPPLAIGPGPKGMRVFYGVRGGRITGERVSGTVLPGGGDWTLVGHDGWARLDVRGQVRTDDGALLYVAYDGVLELNGAIQAAVASGGETGFDEQYYRIAPVVETGDERYAWMTQSTFVGRGRVTRGPGVEYEVFRVC